MIRDVSSLFPSFLRSTIRGLCGKQRPYPHCLLLNESKRHCWGRHPAVHYTWTHPSIVHDARASKILRSDTFRTGFGIRGEHVPRAMRKRPAQGKSCSPRCIMWELESPLVDRIHSAALHPKYNKLILANTAVFVRVLGGRDGLSHSGKIVVGNRT